ncbi:GNAT family N-acetyltransferase [Sneathiella aquimaris]|uniref:GNAT family N-acetyltransferase n=1 Tax=Sneathiella aquimaris TaxID=2599305 RepID=UPI00146D3D47|nr:GNAT family N-acetyltransferase [Sneathiella aquimaris]
MSAGRPDRNNDLIFETERLVFRKARLSDAAFIFELLNQPSFIKYIGDREIHELEDACNYIRDLHLQYRTIGYGSFVVVLKRSGEAIGLSGLIKRRELPFPDVGFAYLPDHWRKGYAFEGAQALLSYGYDVLKLGTIIAITSQNNTESQRLLERLGLFHTRSERLPGKPEETLIFEPE